MIVAIVQARMGSNRLPGKVLRKVLDKPLLGYLTSRLKSSKLLNNVVIATADGQENRPIIEFCDNYGVDFFYGSEDDVLDRYYQAAKKFNAKIVVRITGDCPLVDPNVVDRTIQYFLDGGFDYVSNGIEYTFPDGTNVEVFSFEMLEKAWNEAVRKPHREHVTLFMKDNHDKIKFGIYKNDKDLSKYRYCVDNSEDFEVVSKIIKAIFPKNNNPSMEDIIKFLDNYPDIFDINSGIKRGEGLRKSLENERVANEI